MRGQFLIPLLFAASAYGQKCGMAMQIHREDMIPITPKEQANEFLASITTPLTVDYIRCEGDNGSCLARLEVEKAHAEELKREFDIKKAGNIEVTDAFCPEVKSEL